MPRPGLLAPADRIRRTAATGAYKKMTAGPVSSMLTNDHEDALGQTTPFTLSPFLVHSLHRLLLPRLRRSLDSPFSALRYPALVALGYSGPCPEHTL